MFIFNHENIFGVAISLLSINAIFAQNIKPNGASVTQTKFQGKDAIKVVMDTSIKTFDEPTFAKLIDTNFHDGTIEVNVFNKFIPGAPDWARGFIGIAFRINDNNSKFECVYFDLMTEG